MKALSIFNWNCPVVLLLFLFVCSPLKAQDMNQVSSKVVGAQNFGSLEWMACPEPLNFEGCMITVLNGDPAQANSDILFKMEPGTTAPKHWHTSAERMVMISGEMHVTYDGEAKQVLTAGSYAYGPAGKAHIATCVGEIPCVVFIAFEKPVDSYAGSK